MPTVIEWNGRDVPKGFRSLPVGRYVVESADRDAMLTRAEEAGIEAALKSLRAGRGIALSEVKRRIRRTIAR